MSFESSISRAIEAIQSLSSIRPAIDRALDLILRTLQSGGKLLICGNGGSAAESAHFATELVGRFAKTRRPLAAIALSSDGSLLSCITNDFGPTEIFARQVEGLSRSGDLLVVLSSSGRSANIVEALQEARRQGLSSVAFLGRGGGEARGLATCDVIIPGEVGASAQEAHLFLIHYICEQIDECFV